MGIIKEPLDIDFEIDNRPLSMEEERLISDFIRSKKEQRLLNNTMNSKKPSLKTKSRKPIAERQK